MILGPAKQRFRSLDGLRGICAITIVLLHSELLFNAGAIFCHGYLAVDVFFMLSGFVIAASYEARLADSLNAWSFLKIRVRRLAPVYWAGTMLCVIAALLQSHYQTSVSPAHVVTYGAMAFVLIPCLGQGMFAWPANPVAWTLAWEIVVNFLYAGSLRRAASLWLLAIAAPLLALATLEAFANPRGWSFGMTGADIGMGGLRAMPEFLIGVVLYRWHQIDGFARIPKITPLLPLAAWLVLAVLPQGLSPLLDLGVVTIAAPLLIATLLRGEAEAPAWFSPLGSMSYPLYASHMALIWLAQHTPVFGLDRGARPLLAAGVVLLALGVAWAIHLLFDPAARSRPTGGPTFPAFPPETTALTACDRASKSV